MSSEVLKKLKSYLQDEVIKSAVITIPAMFNDTQKSATQKAAELAGISQAELLQEPIAAAMAYGLDEKTKDGNLLIFDFGGGTFDVCLVKMEDGIMQVKDTDGDNWLGGKTLDNAIVDEILVPYLKENYTIDSFLEDETKKILLKNALKVKAEEIKINLSFSNSYDVISNLGEYPEDDEGEEINESNNNSSICEVTKEMANELKRYRVELKLFHDESIRKATVERVADIVSRM